MRIAHKAVWGSGIRAAVALGACVLAASCSSQVREGQGSSYLIITTLQGAPGNNPGQFGTPLLSDVVTRVGQPPAPAIFNDLGQVAFQLALKDPGSPSSPNTPTVNNFITLDRYHVDYVRADGRNTPGVDVPYGFDGALTATVTGVTTVSFNLVRDVAKEEAPLQALSGNPVIITTLAQVTFYGHDQAGRDVTVSGNIEIDFGDFADSK
ncbi:MAG TPA: hypothetical protein VFX12_01240 [Vicinamibacterales bacterium]|nr:hypothetical protein [Vicinamibacterales bacterium]